MIEFANNSWILKCSIVPDGKETELLKFTSEAKTPGVLGRKRHVLPVIETILFYCSTLKMLTCYGKNTEF